MKASPRPASGRSLTNAWSFFTGALSSSDPSAEGICPDLPACVGSETGLFDPAPGCGAAGVRRGTSVDTGPERRELGRRERAASVAGGGSDPGVAPGSVVPGSVVLGSVGPGSTPAPPGAPRLASEAISDHLGPEAGSDQAASCCSPCSGTSSPVPSRSSASSLTQGDLRRRLSSRSSRPHAWPRGPRARRRRQVDLTTSGV